MTAAADPSRGTRQIARTVPTSRTATSSRAPLWTNELTLSSRSRGGAVGDRSHSSAVGRIADDDDILADEPSVTERGAGLVEVRPVGADVAAGEIRRPDAEPAGSVDQPDEPADARVDGRRREPGATAARGRVGRAARPTPSVRWGRPARSHRPARPRGRATRPRRRRTATSARRRGRRRARRSNLRRREADPRPAHRLGRDRAAPADRA